MLAGQLHSHQCPKYGVAYDCDSKNCARFRKECDRCPFSLA